ncbi:hypothetical protein [Luteolibacter luteus]|uniref:Uncharacterized protein n=1 Tax=Luteolibacter luteus TaxID=2728835 RepID=A0A858RGH4_9BACT|nr:hypothetical protein [Luteolibacter luteus]QJE95233.1 hypothetical protein HHL09_05405 [Luteolibacter luteus]
MIQAPSIIKDRPEDCEIGEMVLPVSVPHWDARIRLCEFRPSGLKPGEKPWIFAASYKGLDATGWKRIE